MIFNRGIAQAFIMVAVLATFAVDSAYGLIIACGFAGVTYAILSLKGKA